MSYSAVTNPRALDATGERYRLDVTYDDPELGLRSVEIGPDLTDMPDSAELLERMLAGDFGPIAPAPRTRVAFLDFMGLFSQAEQVAIVGSNDVRAKLFCMMAAGQGEITLSDPRVEQGVDLFVSLGLLAANRKSAILAGTPAS